MPDENCVTMSADCKAGKAGFKVTEGADSGGTGLKLTEGAVSGKASRSFGMVGACWNPPYV